MIGARARRAPVVVGIGESPFSLAGDASEYEYSLQAIVAALDDAGLAARDVDGVTRFDADAVWEFDLTTGLGVRDLAFYNVVPYGAGGAPTLLRMAALGVAAGLAEVVLAYHGCNRLGRVRYGPGMVGAPREHAGAVVPGAEQFQRPFGIVTRAHEAALVARRLMHDQGVTEAQLADVAVAMRAHAARNPRALHRQPITRADHRIAPYVAEPLRTLDCAADAAGACCLVVTSAERARDLRRHPVTIGASMQVVLPQSSGALLEWHDGREAVMDRAVRRLFGEGAVDPADVDAVYLHDEFTPLVLLGLEDHGFCARGEGGALVESGAIAWPAGRLPVNTNGGQLGEAHLDGINNVVEAVRQLRGESSVPVAGAEVALVAGSPLGPSGAVILTR